MRLVLVPERYGLFVRCGVPDRAGGELIIPGSAPWKGWLAVHSARGWWNVGVGRPQPKERTCILSGGLLHHDIGSAPTETSPSFGFREADWRGVVGCLLFCPPTPAHPNTPSGLSSGKVSEPEDELT